MRLVLVLAATLLTGCAGAPNPHFAEDFARGAAMIAPAAQPPRPEPYELPATRPAPVCTAFTDNGYTYVNCQ